MKLSPWAMWSRISTKLVVHNMISFSCSMQLGVREIILRVAKFDMNRKPNTTKSFINRLWLRLNGFGSYLS